MVTSPHQCALALAIPLSYAEFLAELKAPENKDFVKSLVHRHSSLTEASLWEMVYARTAAITTSVAAAVEKRGVTVVQNTTLGNFQQLLKDFSVVTLVAHWRPAQYYASDFLCPQQMATELVDSEQALAPQLRRQLGPEWLQRLQEMLRKGQSEPVIAKYLAQGLNTILASEQIFSPPTARRSGIQAFYDEEYRAYCNRAAMDDWWQGKVIPGNRVEFADRLYPLETVVNAIPEEFTGLLDLTVCNSVLLGNQIKHQRKCMVLVNQAPTSVELRMVIYKGMIELLCRLEMNYMEAAVAIRRPSLKP